jgi:hypothetical protein
MAMLADGGLAVVAIEQGSAVRGAHLPDRLAKKSRSTINCPILECSFSISRSRFASETALSGWPS